MRRTVVTAVRCIAVVVIARRTSRIVRARPPVGDGVRDRAADGRPVCSVVVPARDEADRIGPLLAALGGAPSVAEVIVVDDRSSDATPHLAARAGATVVTGSDPPAGWAGKTWALYQGVERASSEWVVMFDADVTPDRDLAALLVSRATGDGLDLVSVAGCADVPPRTRWLHAAMVHQLVVRFGPPGTGRRLANGQCMAGRRDVVLDGLTAVRHHVVEDVALARHVASCGGDVDFLDATDRLVVRPASTLGELWWGWGRSIGLRGVEPWWRQLVELGILGLGVVLPPIRLAARRADAVDLVALALRTGSLVGTRRAHVDGGVAYWTSPLADPVAFAATVFGIVRPAPVWRGRRPPLRSGVSDGRRAERWRSGIRRRS